MNHCVLTGNLGADPQNFFTPDGVPITTFQLAFRSGKDKTSWMKVTCFHKLADLSARCLHVGARVGIIGTLEQTKWNDDNGNARTGYRLMANTIEFIKTDGRGFDHKNGDNDHEGDEVPFD